jgi:hypothetical protein
LTTPSPTNPRRRSRRRLRLQYLPRTERTTVLRPPCSVAVPQSAIPTSRRSMLGEARLKH